MLQDKLSQPFLSIIALYHLKLSTTSKVLPIDIVAPLSFEKNTGGGRCLGLPGAVFGNGEGEQLLFSVALGAIIYVPFIVLMLWIGISVEG